MVSEVLLQDGNKWCRGLLQLAAPFRELSTLLVAPFFNILQRGISKQRNEPPRLYKSTGQQKAKAPVEIAPAFDDHESALLAVASMRKICFILAT